MITFNVYLKYLQIDVKSIFTREEAHINRLLKDVVDSLYVSAAFQKAFIEVTEKGSEAAAGNGTIFKQFQPVLFFLHVNIIKTIMEVYSLLTQNFVPAI